MNVKSYEIEPGADLRSADLRSANLGSANLRSANLGDANLGSAYLSYADLRSANLRSANLGDANLGFADLHSANLSFADLRFANMEGATLPYGHGWWQGGSCGPRKRMLRVWVQPSKTSIYLGCVTTATADEADRMIDEFVERWASETGEHGWAELQGAQEKALLRVALDAATADAKRNSEVER